MGRLTVSDIIKYGHISCPACKGQNWAFQTDCNYSLLQCLACGRRYSVYNEIPSLIFHQSDSEEIKGEMQNFWGELYKKTYLKDDRSLFKERLSLQFSDLEGLFLHRRHLAVVEMPFRDLKGKRVLEIGSGAGAHSAFLASKGAFISSVDLTLDRVMATAGKLDRVDGECHIALQADAENLPFPDGHFDIVYSNGVLHHTPHTEKAVNEVHRVLKTGGYAAIMLYARHSFMYWINLFLFRGLLLGNMFRSRDWLGRVTEWMSPEKQNAHNPETKVYSFKEIKRLFRLFREINIRKNSFDFYQIPVMGKYLSKCVGKFTGYNQAGKLLYGRPWRNETRTELWLGKYIGFGLNILAKK